MQTMRSHISNQVIQIERSLLQNVTVYPL